MSNRRHREPDRALARAFVRNARAFQEVGQAAQGRTRASSAYYLAIAIELGLKAFLLHRGITDKWSRIHLTHDLTKALRRARMAGLRTYHTASKRWLRLSPRSKPPECFLEA